MTLCDWVADIRHRADAIGDQLRRAVSGAAYLQTDSTSVTVPDDRAGSFKGRLSVYLDLLIAKISPKLRWNREDCGRLA